MKNVSVGSLVEDIVCLYNSMSRLVIVSIIMVLVTAPLLLLSQTVSAAQLEPRSLHITNSIEGATGVTYTFTFTPATSSDIQSMYFESCNTAVGTCVAPTGLNLEGTATLTSGWAGSPTAPTANTSDTTPACNVVSNLCITWTDTTAQSTSTPLVVTVTGVTNQSSSSTCSATANCTFFVRMFTYSDTAFTTLVDSGNVASSTTQPLTVKATIQEELTFCVGTANGASSTVETYNYALPTCSTLTGTSLNLGTLTYQDVSVSPVPTTQPDNGDLNNGVVELSTNAFNGTTIAYTAVQQAGTNHQGALRVVGATCASGASNTDQCITSNYNSTTPTSTTALTAGTEGFGMAIPGVNCSNAPTIAGYTCSATAHNLVVQSPYDCASGDLTTSFSVTDPGGQNTGTTSCVYAWDESGAVDTIAASASPNGVVPDESLLVEFAATPAVTTPTGAYTAQADFIATPVY
jgi:hypothetical protein